VKPGMRWLFISIALLIVVGVFIAQRKDVRVMVDEDPKTIFNRIIENLSQDTEMVKRIDCRNEIPEIKSNDMSYETCFAYKWFAPAWQTYVKKTLEKDLGEIKLADNDYGVPAISYHLKNNSKYYILFVYRTIDRSYFLKQFDDLKGYKGQINVIVGEK
jgi:hypothetical protein